jgi:adenosylcobyric acid synthase
MLAAVTGTLGLLPDELRMHVRGIVVNRFRGDVALLRPGLDLLEDRTGVPVLGVLPELDASSLDTEDSLDLDAVRRPLGRGTLDVAAVRFPHASNWSDLDPIAHDPAASVRLVSSAAAVGEPDLIVLPGSRRVLADLRWLRERGLADAIVQLARSRAVVLGICGGYQMLGARISDPGVEERGRVHGLGLLAVETNYVAGKLTRWRDVCAFGMHVRGFDMRHGRVHAADAGNWIAGDASVCAGRVFGTNLHALFEHDGFRRTFLEHVAAQCGRSIDAPEIDFGQVRAMVHDEIADAIDQHLRPETWPGELCS